MRAGAKIQGATREEHKMIQMLSSVEKFKDFCETITNEERKALRIISGIEKPEKDTGKYSRKWAYDIFVGLMASEAMRMAFSKMQTIDDVMKMSALFPHVLPKAPSESKLNINAVTETTHNLSDKDREVMNEIATEYMRKKYSAD